MLRKIKIITMRENFMYSKNSRFSSNCEYFLELKDKGENIIARKIMSYFSLELIPL